MLHIQSDGNSHPELLQATPTKVFEYDGERKYLKARGQTDVVSHAEIKERFTT